ncbi:MAG TPA: NADP-dependent phosphogluconate dehydrogenase [Anaerolineales bacterium]|nr:NADP-dependent phosphogluconate dehydrogenase [Anaerolineales bacterium]
MTSCDLGLIGLAVMGQNLVLNMARNGFRLAVYNRTAARTEEFMSGPAEGEIIQAAYSVEELVGMLKEPRTVMLMVQAGQPVEAVIEQLRPHLKAGDLVIDGGNSYFKDTEGRSEALAQAGINFLGIGISGGEAGALWGPSIMPGGQRQAYTRVEPIFTAIAAKVDGEPCVTYIGPRGAGHYVKMAHNGIEYGVMQLIAEIYDLLRRGLGMPVDEIQGFFERWNEGELGSFLIEITAEILSRQDEESGGLLVEAILDTASQKGTGKWTSQEALDLGVPMPTINAAVDARNLSAYKTERLAAAKAYPGLPKRYAGDRHAFVLAAGEALYASVIAAYAQGFELLRAASVKYDYDLQLGEIARIWRGGCIIRARLLDQVRIAFLENPDLPNLMLAPAFQAVILEREEAWRSIVQTAIELGIPAPAMSASLAAFDAYRSARLPANLIQAQRDYFGAHTYQRVDREGTFHTVWTTQDSGLG